MRLNITVLALTLGLEWGALILALTTNLIWPSYSDALSCSPRN